MSKFPVASLKVEDKVLPSGTLELAGHQLIYEGDGKKVILLLDHVQLYGTVTSETDKGKVFRLDFDSNDAILGDIETSGQGMDEEVDDVLESIAVIVTFSNESDASILFNQLGKVIEAIDEEKEKNKQGEEEDSGEEEEEGDEEEMDQPKA